MTWPLDCVRSNEPLANHTSFRIGGPAEWFAEPSTMEELIELMGEAHRAGVPVCVVGGGTNLLVADRGLRGLMIHLGRTFRTVEVLNDQPDASDARVRCGAAVTTQHLVMLACRHGWGDLELLAGLPGQIGGALAMNAQNIGRFVDQVTLVTTTGAVRHLTPGELRFAYRYTALEPGVVVSADLRFPMVTPEASSERIQGALRYRNTTQDVCLPSAGCAFKNPAGMPAGRLIDQSGFKGARIGDAQVSQRHANFIVNLGQATCEDVLSLMEHIQRGVAQRAGVWLEPEVRVLGERWYGRRAGGH